MRKRTAKSVSGVWQEPQGEMNGTPALVARSLPSTPSGPPLGLVNAPTLLATRWQ